MNELNLNNLLPFFIVIAGILLCIILFVIGLIQLIKALFRKEIGKV